MLYKPVVTSITLHQAADDYLLAKEAQYADIKEDNSSHVIWFRADHAKTPYAIVYLHGFSASPREISPVVESVANNLKANVYFARLSSHGLKNDLMQNLKADQLFQDTEEAYTIGKSIGEKVIFVGTSTGATLALWLASKYNDISGLILISPNLGIYDPTGFLAAGPLGYWIARGFIGPFYEWQPKHSNQDKYWTTRYSVNGVRAMIDVVREVENVSIESIQTPSLVLWTPQDKVVNIHKALSLLKKLGSAQKTFIELTTPEHVLAGAITAPANTAKAVEMISQFIQTEIP